VEPLEHRRLADAVRADQDGERPKRDVGVRVGLEVGEYEARDHAVARLSRAARNGVRATACSLLSMASRRCASRALPVAAFVKSFLECCEARALLLASR
jgi:mitochondrial fission protein ELM1